VENEREKRPKRVGKRLRRKPRVDRKVQESIAQAEEQLRDAIHFMAIRELNGYQRKEIHKHFEKTQEYKVKSYREEDDNVILRVYPVGNLRRLAEQKTQEVLMKGKSEILPPMGSFERFVVHDYLKDREGVKTESFGEKGKDRHVEISPLFGRSPKKTKRKLTR
jgi:predicted RNA-binding protein Jag